MQGQLSPSSGRIVNVVPTGILPHLEDMLMPMPTVILSAIPQTSDRLNSRRNLDAMDLSLAQTHSVPVFRSDSGHATIGVFAMTLHEKGLRPRSDLFALPITGNGWSRADGRR